MVEATREELFFATQGVERSESVATWRDYLSSAYFGLDVRPHSKEHIDGIIARRTLVDLKVSEFRSSAQTVVRTPELAKRDEIERYVFVFPKTGAFGHRQAAWEDVAGFGGSYILSSSLPYEVDISDGASMFCLDADADLLRDRTSGIDDFCIGGTVGDPLLTRLLRDLAETLMHMQPGANAGRLENLGLDLIDMAVWSARRPSANLMSSSAMKGLLLSKIERVIEDRLADQSFRIEHVAVACGVSKRYVQQLLQERSTTFGKEVLNARLAKGAHLLRSRQQRFVSIGEIAAACGFSSQSHFATAFRRKFGRTPRDARSAC